MKTIPLSQSKEAIVDDEHHDALMAMGPWHYSKGYACRNAADRSHPKPYVQTVGQNDRDFVRWAIETRRGALVTVMGGRHAVLACHVDDEWTYLLDNNQPNRYVIVPTDAFWSEWEHSGSWSLAVVYSPVPGLP